MIKKIFLVICIFLILLFGNQIFLEYWANHSYYKGMLELSSNWSLLITTILFTAIPVLYLLFVNKKTLIGFSLSIFGSLFLSGLGYIIIKDQLLGSGGIMWFFSSLVLLFLMLYFVAGLLALGIYIKNKLFKYEDLNIYDYFVSFGLGLVGFLLFGYVLILTNLFYSVINWIIFGILGYLVYYNRSKVIDFGQKMFQLFESLKPSKGANNIFKYIGIFLLIISLVYFLYGFMQAYIPYPTAWDANHSYMFYPKMRAYNAGYYWQEQNMWNAPYLWTSYIAYWFSLFVPFENKFWISPDTIAVVLNFLSGIFVLIFSLTLIREVIDYMSKYFDKNENTLDDIKSSTFLMGWFGILMWLTSGMGAFLVFVDNKTDLGVMALIILAIYSGFEFIKKITLDAQNLKNNVVYSSIVISGVFFAAAVMAKPTAFLDVVNFGMFMTLIWIGFITIVGLFIIILGILSYIKFRGISEYISSKTGLFAIFLGTVISIVGYFEKMILKSDSKTTNLRLSEFIAQQKIYLKYIIIWGLSIFAILLLFKGPYIVYSNIKASQPNSIQVILKRIIFSFNNTFSSGKVYAQEIEGSFVNQSLTGNQNLTGIQLNQSGQELQKDDLDIKSCNLASVGESDVNQLFKDLKEPPGNAYAEDVGRYVGYGWKEFKNVWWAGFLGSQTKCIGGPADAKLLCENSNAIESFDLTKLKELSTKLGQTTQGYKLLSGVINSSLLSGVDLNDSQQKASLINQLSDQIKLLKDYHKDFSIKLQKVCLVSKDNKDAVANLGSQCQVFESDDVKGNDVINQYDVSIPYKYLIPFNITFNRSLQNMSSYYTDIGYIWLIMLMFVVVGLVYGLAKLNKALIGITGVTLLGWVIWFFIGGGILWYGIGLIIWTILAFVVFLYFLYDTKKSLSENYLWLIFVTIFTIFGLFQLIINLMRIGSQGGSGPFVWYKQGVGEVSMIDERLDSKDTQVVGYGWKDVFNLQFPHYNKFIDKVNNRKDGEGVFLAGTYARYFVKNQNGIIYDQFLLWLWKQFSDNDACKSYLRLKEKNIKYIAIDPNIGTVVMGGGNMSLFDRFFAKISSATNKIEEDGVITMLARLSSKGYIKVVSTNNIGAKYAYSMTDEQLKAAAGGNFSHDDLVLLRGRMATARYWQNESMTNLILSIAKSRIDNGYFVSDFADIIGKTIDETKVLKFIVDFSKSKDANQRKNVMAGITQLTQDERLIFTQFLMLADMKSTKEEQFESTLTNLIKQSVTSSSQIIFVEVE